ncbi:magnesium transporter CorA, partial [Micromonospora sp. URMC 106]
MTDRGQQGRAASPNGGRVLRPLDWAAPVRAMTRRLNSDAPQRVPAPAGPRRSAVVDCALYVGGRRQPGDW